MSFVPIYFIFSFSSLKRNAIFCFDFLFFADWWIARSIPINCTWSVDVCRYMHRTIFSPRNDCHEREIQIVQQFFVSSSTSFNFRISLDKLCLCLLFSLFEQFWFHWKINDWVVESIGTMTWCNVIVLVPCVLCTTDAKVMNVSISLIWFGYFAWRVLTESHYMCVI